MTLDIAMGGSTNTVLHLLAAAHEAEVDFTMADIDRLSRRVPVLCKVAPSAPDVHLEDVHRAGGIIAILGELDRAGLLHGDLPTVHSATLERRHRPLGHAASPRARRREHSSAPRPAACRRRSPSARSRRYDDARRRPRERRHPRRRRTPSRKDGGLAVLYGNLALEGCIVKTAGVDASILNFSGPARVFESQDAAVSGILTGEVKSPATWWSSATKGRAAGRACRRCSIRPAI